MNIVLDAMTICDREGNVGAGIEHYTFHVIQEILLQKKTDKFVLIVPSYLPSGRLEQLLQGRDGVRVIKMMFEKIPFFPRHVFLPLLLKLYKAEIYFSPYGQTPYFNTIPSTIVVHDMAIYKHPEWFEHVDKQRFAIEKLVPKSIKKASAVIAVSKRTAKDIVELFPETESKIEVVYNGVEQNVAETLTADSERFPFDRDFILFVGTVEPRKNLESALLAFDQFLQRKPDQVERVRFVIAGKWGWKTARVQQVVDQINETWKEVDPRGIVQVLGMVTDQEKWNLLARAVCLIYPSRYEGFGMPVLEAMSVGTPVITSTEGSLPEVGGDAAMYVEPHDIEAMSLSIDQCVLLPEGVSHLREAGYRRSRMFTWEKTAKQVIDIIEKTHRQ